MHLTTIQKLGYIFGIGFILAGIAGFIPAISPASGQDRLLLGLFRVDVLHNLIHIGSGIAAIVTSYLGNQPARRYFQIFGPLYALVAIIGLAQHHAILGLFNINTWDNGLHVFLALVITTLGVRSHRNGNLQ